MDATTIAVDLAKNVFEVAEQNAAGHVVARRRFTRVQFARFLREHPPAEVVMEACSTAHHWGRTARASGHAVTLLPPQYVRPFVRRQKTDRTDVTGLLDARRSDGLTPVPLKSVAQQALLALHRVRTQWMETRTARINLIRGLLAEHGVVVPKGARHVLSHVAGVLEDADTALPVSLRQLVGQVADEIRALEGQIAAIDSELRRTAQDDVVMQRVLEVPGVGIVTATALVASVTHIHGFQRGRHFASWLGVTPRETSSGERRQLGAITKQGNVYLRGLLVHGARSALLAAGRTREARRSPLQHWALQVMARRGHNRATVALANKLARIIWAVWTKDVPYTATPLAA